MEIVYAYIGKLPPYIVESLYQARLWSPNKITLICDDLTSPYLDQLKQFNISIVPYELVVHREFIACVQSNYQKFCIAEKLGDRRLLFIRSFERFFLLQKYMEITGATNILFLELDLLIYFNPNDYLHFFQQRELTLSYVNEFQVCSAFAYIKSTEILATMNSYFLSMIYSNTKTSDDTMSEMVALHRLLQTKEFRDRVLMLPCLWPDPHFNKDAWENYSMFQSLFDGSGIAIYLDGPDLTHREQWLKNNKVWWGADIVYNSYPYAWKEIESKKVLFLQDLSENFVRVNCLHVHNKNLQVFLSSPLPKDSIAPRDDLIQGDKFLLMANTVLRKKVEKYYDVLGWDKNNITYFEDLPESWDNPKLLFCNTDNVIEFMKHIHKVQNEFVLLSHNSDQNVTSKFLPLVQSPKLVHWFTQNLVESLPKTSSLPIGIANPCWQHGNPTMFTSMLSMNPDKNNYVYANFLPETNPTVRNKCASILKSIQIPLHSKIAPCDFFYKLSSSFFSICPEGNGKDTHRFWESILFKCIPIVLRSHLTEEYAKEFPCILLNTWEDLPNVSLYYNPNIFTPEIQQKITFS